MISSQTVLSQVLTDTLTAEPSISSDMDESRFDPRFIGNLRIRYEGVDEEAFTESSNALTARLRATLETGIGFHTTVLGEIEAVGILAGDFNDGSGNRPERPVIADPDGVEINRLQILTHITPELSVTAGRQRLIYDDERFVGALGFRQNDQTFDAIRVNARLRNNIFIDAAYIGQTNRALGRRNPNGEFEGDSFLFNVNVPIPIGRLAAFHYALDLETGPDTARTHMFSVKTNGVRLLGRHHWDDWGLIWEGAYAIQRDHADNPIDFKADYGLIAATLERDKATLNLRAEILGSDGLGAFQTPLGTLHKFQGEADIFLVTPQNGLVDLSADFRWKFGKVGPLSGVQASIRHHWFSAEQGGADLGTELDINIGAKYNRIGFSVGYARYDADTFGTDTEKLFITTRYPF